MKTAGSYPRPEANSSLSWCLVVVGCFGGAQLRKKLVLAPRRGGWRRLSQFYLSCISAVSQLYLSCISAASQLYLSCISAVSQLYLGCILGRWLMVCVCNYCLCLC